MAIDWDELQKALSPIKDFDDLFRRLDTSFAYPFVSQSFNFTMPELTTYTQKLLGGDPRGRYTEYASKLTGIFAELSQAGVVNLIELKDRTASREQLEEFTQRTGVSASETISALKYLIYWFIPGEKYLSGLVRDDASMSNAIKVLSGLGIRTNLELIQYGITPNERKELARRSNLPLPVITELVNRADFSRMPWASKATISNIIGAGYGSIAQLANADPDRLYADFFGYGQKIGKNLKLGNEIDSSFRIAQIVPKLVQPD